MAKWLLFIHELPPAPAYLRVKVRRQLRQLGAQLLKNSVYVLPHSTGALEDLHWLRREILESGGGATVASADFVEGNSDDDLEGQFRKASDAEYAELADGLRATEGRLQERDVARWRSQLHDVTARDFFSAAGRGDAERALADRLPVPAPASVPVNSEPRDRPAGATWVTREDVHVDRMASAWLIRRFIDPAASFKFVASSGNAPVQGELRFDMFDGEFTHGIDRCTFQTLVAHFGLVDRALEAMGDVIHDIDYKVESARRPETEGIRALVNGICLTVPRDPDRIEAAGAAFSGLYAYFAREA